MKIALAAKITCDPKHVRESRWVHDTAHAFIASMRRALLAEKKPKKKVKQ